MTSSCGHVADPIQTGSSMTTVGCEKPKPCSITIRLSDDGFAPNGCNGTNVWLPINDQDQLPPLGETQHTKKPP